MFDNPTSSEKITVRSLSPEVMKALSRLAGHHDRSLEAEARQAIRSWVQPQIDGDKRVSRAKAVAQRLQYLQEEIGNLPFSGPATASRLAEALGWSYAAPLETWISGEEEASFADLTQISNHLGCRKDWLIHGEGNPYESEASRIPEHATEGPNWLLAPSCAGIKQKLYLVRSRSQKGEFAFIKQNNEWNAKTFYTPYCISDQTGAGGESSLAWLSLVFEGLYRRWTGMGATEISVESYLFDETTFSALLSGKRHPLNILKNGEKICWWEDFWDEQQFRQHQYWPGWSDLTQNIFNVVEGNRLMKEQRDQLRGKTNYQTSKPTL